MSVKFSAPWKKFLFLYRLAIFSPSSTRKLYGRELYFCALFRFRKIICANCVPIQLKTLSRFRSYPIKTIIRKIRRSSVPLRFLGSLRRYSWFLLPRKNSSPLCLLRTLAPHARNFALCPTEKSFSLTIRFAVSLYTRRSKLCADSIARHFLFPPGAALPSEHTLFAYRFGQLLPFGIFPVVSIL